MSEDSKDPSEEPQAGDDPTQPDDENEDGYYEAAPKFQRAVDYMETEKRHAITLRIVEMLEKISPVLNTLLEAKVESHRVRPKLEYRKSALLLAVRFLVFGVAIGSLIYMRKSGDIH